MSKNDVSPSIAGYYKQILEATKELVYLGDETGSVGIECGADVRIFKSDGSKESIEVKFKKDIGTYSKDLYQSVYNFSVNSMEDTKLVFRSNTKEKDFINRSKEEYIIHLLLKYFNKKENMNIEKWYEENRTCTIKKCWAKSICDKCLSELAGFLVGNPEDLNKYINVFISMTELDVFISKIEFDYKDTNKVEDLNNTRSEIQGQLKVLAKKWLTRDLDDKMIESIMYRINALFFDTTVYNSLENVESDEKYVNEKKVSYRDLKNQLLNNERYLNLEENKTLSKYLKVYENLTSGNLNGESIVERFLEEYKEFSDLKDRIGSVSEKSIIDYFSDSQKWYASLDDRQEQITRFVKYSKGYGIVAYIMSQNITTIDLHKDNLFVYDYFNSHVRLNNESYYDFQSIKEDFEKSIKNENEVWKAAEVGDYYCLISDLNSFIQISKTKNTMSTLDYLEYNDIGLNTIEKLKDLLNSKKNILVLKARPHEARNLVSVLVDCIPDKLHKYFYSEDVRNLPNNIGNNTRIIDTLNESEELYEKIETLINIEKADYALLNLEFVDTLSEGYRRYLETLGNYDKTSIILFENYNVSRLISVENYEEIKKHYIFNIPDYFDAVLVFDYCIKNNKQRDTINIFTK